MTIAMQCVAACSGAGNGSRTHHAKLGRLAANLMLTRELVPPDGIEPHSLGSGFTVRRASQRTISWHNVLQMAGADLRHIGLPLSSPENLILSHQPAHSSASKCLLLERPPDSSRANQTAHSRRLARLQVLGLIDLEVSTSIKTISACAGCR